jgi:transposase
MVDGLMFNLLGGVCFMSTKRKRHSAEFKVKVALEAVHTLQQLAKEFQVHPAQITIWKKQLTGQVASLFQRGPAGTALAAEELAAGV